MMIALEIVLLMYKNQTLYFKKNLHYFQKPKKLQEGFKDWIPLNNVKSGQIYVEVETRPLKEGEEIQVFYAEDENDAELRKARERGETYYPLKGSIYPPSNWKPDVHHDKLPPVDLKLEFAYGYRYFFFFI